MLAAYASASFAGAPEFRFEHAEFVVSDAATPPQSGWQPQALPDSWRHNHPGLRGVAWYRMRFVLDAIPAEVMALYAGRASFTGQFWLNGVVLNPDVGFSGPKWEIGAFNGRWPTLIPLSAGLLRHGDNVVHIRLESSGFAGGGHGLWDVRVAPLERLHATWLMREIPQRTLPQAMFVLMAVSAVFSFLVWWRDPRVRNFHFAAVMLLWTLIVGHYIGPMPSVTMWTVSFVLTTLYLAFFWTLLALFYRYSESQWRWYLPTLHLVFTLTLISALALLMFQANGLDSPRHMGLILVSTVVMRVLATGMLLQAAWRSRFPRAYALAGTEIVWFAGHIQLIGMIAGWLPPDPFRLDPAGSLPLFLVLLYFFVDGLIRERDEAIRERHAAVTTERARILQDMHDGTGAQLITALRLAQRADGDRALVARSIEEALQDMRLVIDSVDESSEGLAAALANLRHRLEPRLAALGIRLDWQVPGHAALAKLTPTSVLGILRILQEAINNAVKHSRSSAIAVAVTRDGNQTLIAVSDDGIGFDPAAVAAAGRGLSGMHKRAEVLGGTLQVLTRDGGGTRVILRLPAVPQGRPALGNNPAGVSQTHRGAR